MKHLCAKSRLFRGLLLLLFGTASIFLNAQSGYEIRVKLSGYNYDTVWIGRSFGKRAVPEMPGTRQADGWYLVKNDSIKPEGMYAVVYKRAAKAKFQFFPLWITDKERRFSVETNIDKPYRDARFGNSTENENLFAYLRDLDPLTDRRDSLAFEHRDLQTEASYNHWIEADKAVREYQDYVISAYQGTKTAEFATQTHFPEAPTEGATWRDQERNRWLWMKKHYFDQANATDPNFFRSPIFIEWMDYFTFKMPPPVPDSIRAGIREVFKRLQPNPDHFKYYFNYVTNSFGGMSKYRGDEIFAWLIREYVEKGQAPWTKPEEMEKMLDDAKRMEKLFIGLPAPSVTFFDKNEVAHPLYDLKSAFTLIVFWNPDCGHCQKELPVLKRVCEPYTAKGMKVIAVCGKTREEEKTCWEFADKNPFPESWLLCSDKQNKSRLGYYFNLRTFPRMFLLDANKKIIWKRVGEVPERELIRVFSREIKG